MFLPALYLLRSRDTGLGGPVVACVYISKIPDFGLQSALFQRTSSDQTCQSSLGNSGKKKNMVLS